ncbi:MAG TPA: DinB family protein, partial [Acidimicrobiia bacterium]|nr:DinB family protein [Acidimicrobiia bacterium]
MSALTTPFPHDAAGPPALHERYCRVRRHTETLAAPLSPEDQVVQSMPDASPTKWHRAHTTWFFETFLLVPRLPGYERFDPAYEYLFNSYYEAVGPRHPRPKRGLISRPSVDDIARYRAHVDDAMRALIDARDEQPDRAGTVALIELGLHHEQQHQELLLMDIKHVLHCNPTDPPYARRPHANATSSVPGFVEIDGGDVAVGHDFEGDRGGAFA